MPYMMPLGPQPSPPSILHVIILILRFLFSLFMACYYLIHRLNFIAHIFSETKKKQTNEEKDCNTFTASKIQ